MDAGSASVERTKPVTGPRPFPSGAAKAREILPDGEEIFCLAWSVMLQASDIIAGTQVGAAQSTVCRPENIGSIVNISMSGAAITLDSAEMPPVGTRVRIGSRCATVVRLTEDGMAVEFLEPFTPDTFDERVRP